VRIPERPPGFESLHIERDQALAFWVLQKPLVRGRYRHWDELRRLPPPEGLTSELWWLAVSMARESAAKLLPFKDAGGAPFHYVQTDPALEMLHQIDQRAAGEVRVPELVTTRDESRRYLVNSLTEEAITSSQLEGANTTRRVAKDMLRSGRAPRTKGETMIVNNLAGLEFIRDRRGEPLTPETVLELHAILTKDTLDPDDVGRLQRPGEHRVAVEDVHGNVLHEPPAAEELPQRLEDMCRFANGDLKPEGFLHPVVRAILVHFWLAYDHPFVDGNGRTARALFYWSMLREGYWLTEYLSISRILRGAPAKYGRSFLYTETDDNDTTYFVLYQLEVIRRAIDELHEYLARKTSELRQLERSARAAGGFNSRQLALLSHALRNPDAVYTFDSHQRSHGVVYESARKDLLVLAERGLLVQRKIGRRFVFDPAPDLADRLTA